MQLTCFYINKVYKVARGVQLLQQTLETNFRRLRNFLGFSRGYLIRNNPLKLISKNIVNSVKEMLTITKKLKMAQYRLNYHRHQLYKMEKLIAENNEHTFLKGNKMNHVR